MGYFITSKFYMNSYQIIQHFYNLPDDIIYHIDFFIKSSYANTIRNSFIKYMDYKEFIIDSIYDLPLYHSLIDDSHVHFNICSPKTQFFFHKLYIFTHGNESYYDVIENLFYLLACSVDDYEWVSCRENHNYSLNKFYCTSIASKFNIQSIIELLN